MHGPRNIRKPKTAKLSSRPKVPREPFTISGLKSSFGLRVEAPVCKVLGASVLRSPQDGPHFSAW